MPIVYRPDGTTEEWAMPPAELRVQLVEATAMDPADARQLDAPGEVLPSRPVQMRPRQSPVDRAMTAAVVFCWLLFVGALAVGILVEKGILGR